MVRQIIFLFFILGGASALCGAPWGAMQDFAQPVKNASADAGQASMGAHYLLPKILEGHPINIYVSVSPGKENQLQKYQALIAKNYNKWFTETAKMIQKNKRQQEFGDILPLLQKGVNVKFLTEETEADISFYIVPLKEVQQQCGRGAGGCYFRVASKRERAQIILPEDQFWVKLISRGKVSVSSIGLHEIGHSLGLGDQYEGALYQNTHEQYSSIQPGKGTMKDNSDISCDEADGLINLIDLIRHTARGGARGWKSLCPRSDEFYVRGQSASKGPFYIEQKENDVFVLHTYKQGEEISSQVYTFQNQGSFLPTVFSEETVRQRDALGRPVWSVGPGGEQIYYSYRFDEYLRLVVRAGRAILAEYESFSGKGRGKIKYRTVLFKQNDRWIKATAAYGRNKAGSIEYQEASAQSKMLLYLTFNLDEKGNVFQTYARKSPSAFQKTSGVAAAALAGSLSAGTDLLSSVEKSVEDGRLEQVQRQLIKWFQKAR